MEWNYKSIVEKSNGYEDILDKLKSFTKEKYINSSDKEKESMIHEIFNVYRTKNIFPIQYYNHKGIIKEIEKCRDKEVDFDGEVLNLKFNQGSSVCRFLFPNLQMVECKGVKNNSPYFKFMDDKKLYRAIKYCLDHKTIKSPVLPTSIKDGLEMLGGNVATNFKPMNAKALYEKYCPENGVIYDFACGFGGRMLGALSSKKNYKYFGVEPCEKTYESLNKLGRLIEEATYRENIFKIFCKGSEDFRPKIPHKADFAFSSPPYFNLEKYSDENTQCYNKYPNIEDWIEGYVKPTIQNIHYILKTDCYYAVNIADFKIGEKEVKYVDEWIKISEEVGFKYIKQIHMKLQTRRGNGHKDAKGNERIKKEGIFIFKKINNTLI